MRCTHTRPKCVKMATFSSKCCQNGDLFVKNASTWRPFRSKWVKIETVSSKMHQNGDCSAQHASKLRLCRPKCIKFVTCSSQLRQNCNFCVQNGSKWWLWCPKCENVEKPLVLIVFLKVPREAWERQPAKRPARKGGLGGGRGRINPPPCGLV